MRAVYTAESPDGAAYLDAYDIRPDTERVVLETWPHHDCEWYALGPTLRTNPEPTADSMLGDLPAEWTVREACRWLSEQRAAARQDAGAEPEARVPRSPRAAAELAEVSSPVTFAERDTRSRLITLFGDAGKDTLFVTTAALERLKRPTKPILVSLSSDKDTQVWAVSTTPIEGGIELPALVEGKGAGASPVMPRRARLERDGQSWDVLIGHTDTLTVPTPTGVTDLPVVYMLAPFDAVLPSHTSAFSRSDGYPVELQERAYHTDKAEQAKVIRQASNFRAGLTMYAASSAADGPPIVTQSGLVVGGNSRAITLRIVHDRDPAGYLDSLRTALADDLRTGLSFAPRAELYEHVIVRVLLADVEPAGISRLLNQALTQSLSQRAMVASVARVLVADNLHLLDGYENDLTATVRAFLRKRSKDAAATLTRLGIVTQSNRADWVTDRGELTSWGTAIVELSLAACVCARPAFGSVDFDVFDRLSDGLLAASVRCAVPLYGLVREHPATHAEAAGSDALDVARYVLQEGPQGARDSLLTIGMFGGASEGTLTTATNEAFLWGVWWARASRAPERAAGLLRIQPSLFGADDSLATWRAAWSGGRPASAFGDPTVRAEWLDTLALGPDESALRFAPALSSAPSSMPMFSAPAPAALPPPMFADEEPAMPMFSAPAPAVVPPPMFADEEPPMPMFSASEPVAVAPAMLEEEAPAQRRGPTPQVAEPAWHAVRDASRDESEARLGSERAATPSNVVAFPAATSNDAQSGEFVDRQILLARPPDGLTFFRDGRLRAQSQGVPQPSNSRAAFQAGWEPDTYEWDDAWPVEPLQQLKVGRSYRYILPVAGGNKLAMLALPLVRPMLDLLWAVTFDNADLLRMVALLQGIEAEQIATRIKRRRGMHTPQDWLNDVSEVIDAAPFWPEFSRAEKLMISDPRSLELDRGYTLTRLKFALGLSVDDAATMQSEAVRWFGIDEADLQNPLDAGKWRLALEACQTALTLARAWRGVMNEANAKGDYDYPAGDIVFYVFRLLQAAAFDAVAYYQTAAGWAYQRETIHTDFQERARIAGANAFTAGAVLTRFHPAMPHLMVRISGVRLPADVYAPHYWNDAPALKPPYRDELHAPVEQFLHRLCVDLAAGIYQGDQKFAEWGDLYDKVQELMLRVDRNEQTGMRPSGVWPDKDGLKSSFMWRAGGLAGSQSTTDTKLLELLEAVGTNSAGVNQYDFQRAWESTTVLLVGCIRAMWGIVRMQHKRAAAFEKKEERRSRRPVARNPEVWSTITAIARAVVGIGLVADSASALTGRPVVENYEGSSASYDAQRIVSDLQRDGIVTVATPSEARSLSLALQVIGSLTEPQDATLQALARSFEGRASAADVAQLERVAGFVARHSSQRDTFGHPRETWIGPMSPRHLALLGWGHDPSDPRATTHAEHVRWKREHGF
jgi:hypothetical protein